jgi:hypothetical protein
MARFLPRWAMLSCVAALLASITAVNTEAQIQQTWSTATSDDYKLYGLIHDLNHDGIVELLCLDPSSGANPRLTLRSAATGAIEAQSTNAYQPLNILNVDTNADGSEELLVHESIPQQGIQRLVCLTFTVGSMVERWAITLGVSGAFYFADLDGNGQLYFIVLDDRTPTIRYDIYRNNGALLMHYTPNPPKFWVPEYVTVLDVDNDSRDEILFVFKDNTGFETRQHLILLESVGPTSVEPGSSPSLRSIELGASVPNPMAGAARIEYSVPARGPASLRLLDVSGRTVRVLENGVVEAGRHQATWDGRDAQGRAMPAGVYFYELTAAGMKQGRQLVRLP